MQDPIVEHFKNNYQLLTRKQKAVWCYLQGISRSYSNVMDTSALDSRGVVV